MWTRKRNQPLAVIESSIIVDEVHSLRGTFTVNISDDELDKAVRGHEIPDKFQMH